MSERRDILIITGNPVVDTGKLSRNFEKAAGLDSGTAHFGRMWQQSSDRTRIDLHRDDGLCISSSNLSQHCHDEVVRALRKLPACIMLMDKNLFAWFELVARKYGVEFRAHHYHNVLTTS